jgi:WD40 repeat protein
MSVRPVAVWLFLCVPGLVPPSVRADTGVLGDPLPPGALARLGTMRLRHGGRVAALVLAANGRLVAVAGDDLVEVWDTSSGKEVHRLHTTWVGALAFAPDGKTLAAGTGIGGIHLWDMTTGKELRHFGGGAQGRVHALAFAPGGTLLASAGTDGSVRLWRVATGEEAGRLTGHDGPIVALAFAPRGTALAGAGSGVFLWEPGSGKFLGKLGGPRASVAVCFTPDGNRVAAVDKDFVLRVWEGSAGKERLQIPGGSNQIIQAALAANGKRAVLLGKDHILHRWDLESGKELLPVRLQGGGGRLALSPDGQLLAAVEGKHAIRLWSAEDGKERVPTTGHRGDLLALVYSSDGRALTSVARDRTVLSWDPVSGKNTRIPGAWSRGRRFLALAPDGKTVAVQESGAVVLLDVPTQEERQRLASPGTGPALAAVFSGDGSSLAVSYIRQPIYLWRLADGGGPLRLTGHPDGASALAFSPDHQLLASAGGDRHLRLWEVTTGKELAAWKAGLAHTLLVFSPDGGTLATENQDGMIALRDVVTGKEVRQLQGHADAIHALVFAPDGRVLASGGDDSFVRVWELTSGQEVRRFQGHSGPVTAVAFAPDGRTLASGSTDTSVLVWDLTGQGKAGAKAVARLRPEELDRLWEQLAGPDSSKAYDAVWSLAGHAEDSLPYLRQRLELFLGTDPQRIERLIRELDHDRYEVREKATADLEKLGRWAEPALRKHLTGMPTLEAQRRIERILDTIKGGLSWPRERLRIVRAAAVLEAIASPAARQTLEKLAQRGPEEELRAQAEAALKRLGRRK